MKILHVSDTHGPVRLAALPTDFDVLCHTGDWAPDPSFSSDRAIVVPYQMDFFRHEATALAAWLGGRPLVFCLGNHDLLSEAWVERELGEAGVAAHAPGARPSLLASVEKQRFLGMRETPFIDDAFEGGCTDERLAYVTSRHAVRWYPNHVLLAHCPPQCVLAGPSERQWGNSHLRSWLENGMGDLAPRLVLCGHIHECFGRETIGSSLVVNSACGWSLVDTAGPKVVRIGGRGR